MQRKVTGLVVAAATLQLLSCTGMAEQNQGSLRLHFASAQYGATKTSDPQVPDTSAFLLTITDSSGKDIYDGSFGDSPQKIPVEAGTYYVSVRSRLFSKPEFSAPQYGDDQCVVVTAGRETDVRLSCRQVNSGIRLLIGPDFLENYPDGLLYVSSEDGKLLYSYRERRIAYFKPGEVSVMLSSGGGESQVFSRILEPREILSLSIAAPPAAPSGKLSIAVDTTRTWTDESFTLGGSSGAGSGSTVESALDVVQARGAAPAEDVWVYGYIAGAFKSSSNISFSAPYPSATNLAISSRPSVSDKDACLSVELRKGALRDELNLFDHPDLKGRKLFLRGTLVESYYGIPGLKAVTDWFLE